MAEGFADCQSRLRMQRVLLAKIAPKNTKPTKTNTHRRWLDNSKQVFHATLQISTSRALKYPRPFHAFFTASSHVHAKNFPPNRTFLFDSKASNFKILTRSPLGAASRDPWACESNTRFDAPPSLGSRIGRWANGGKVPAGIGIHWDPRATFRLLPRLMGTLRGRIARPRSSRCG